MLKHCHATAIEHRRGNSQRSLKSVNNSPNSDNSSLNSSSFSGSSSTGSVNCSLVGSETSASSSFVLASPVSLQANTSSNCIANTSINTLISSSAIPNTGNHPADSRRSSYSSPEPLLMASRTSSYASLSTTDGSLIHANGKIFLLYLFSLFFSVKSKMSKFTIINLIR